MIPADRYSPVAAQQLFEYLLTEYERVKRERGPLEDNWLRWQRMYRARPEDEQKDFPFPGCSNLEIALIGDDVDVIYSRVMSMLFVPDSLWATMPQRPEMIEFARRAAEFIAWAQRNEIKPQPAVSEFILELCKLGTGILKTRYHREVRKVYEFREVMGQFGPEAFERQANVMVHDAPNIAHVSLFNFYIPPACSELAHAPWCAERIPLYWSQLLNRATSGIYTNLGNLDRWRATFRGTPYELQQQRLTGFTTSQADQFEIIECWTNWDIDGDGQLEAVVCTFHPESRTILRIDFNPFLNQEFPYDVARYQRVEKSFYGMGIAEMLEQYQIEVSTLHNQRIDNGTIANAQVIKALKHSGITEDEPIFPGRVLLLDNLDDVVAMPFGMERRSTIGDEQITIQHAKSRTGVNDYVAGADSASANYATATVAVQQLREGAKRFDQVLREIRGCLSGVGTKVLELYQQFWQGGKPYTAMGDKDGAVVSQVLQFPLDLVRSSILVDVTATSAQYNKEVELRTNMIVTQQLQQYYAQVLGMLQIALNPGLPPQMQYVAMQAAEGATALLRRALDTQGVQDAESLLPDMTNAFGQVRQYLAQFGLNTGAGATPAGFGAAPGVPVISGSAAPTFGNVGSAVAPGVGYGAGAPVAGRGVGF